LAEELNKSDFRHIDKANEEWEWLGKVDRRGEGLLFF